MKLLTLLHVYFLAERDVIRWGARPDQIDTGIKKAGREAWGGRNIRAGTRGPDSNQQDIADRAEARPPFITAACP